MSKTKLLSLISNLAIFANLVVGFLAIHWAVIAVFIVVHSVLRLNYLKAESQAQTLDPSKTQTTIAPPMVRNIASVITAVILAIAIYWLGFAVGYLTK